jgi:hypothetical protein
MTQKQPLPTLSLQGMAQLRRYLPHGGGVVKRTAVCIGSVKPSVAAFFPIRPSVSLRLLKRKNRLWTGKSRRTGSAQQTHEPDSGRRLARSRSPQRSLAPAAASMIKDRRADGPVQPSRMRACCARLCSSCSLGAVLDHHERSEFGRMQASRRPNQR